MGTSISKRIAAEIERMPAGVRAHIEQVRAASLELAKCHRADPEKAELAAITHDICRLAPAAQLLAQARDLGVEVTPIDEAVPVFLHGPVGAAVLRQRYSVEDREVLDAIGCHTVGREGMTVMDKVLFLADKLDPGKVGRYPFIAEVGQLARVDLDCAMLLFIDHLMRAFIEHREIIHPRMAAARNDALLAVKGK